MTRLILSAVLMFGVALAYSPTAALAREKGETPRQEDKHKPSKPGKHGGKHGKDDRPGHR